MLRPMSSSFWSLAVAFAALMVRAVQLTVIEGDEMRQLAVRQHRKQVKLPPKRGPVLDRHGNRLAVSVDVPSVYANPREVGERAHELAEQLAKILDAGADCVGGCCGTTPDFIRAARTMIDARGRGK